ncbi:4345_t:CDS:2, partial [Gigaspora rosea]
LQINYSIIAGNQSNNCDNCQKKNKENLQLTDASSEILEMLEVVEASAQNSLINISSDDIVDVFSRLNTNKIQKNKYNELTLQRESREVKLYKKRSPTILVPKETAQIALNDLVYKGISENAKQQAEKKCWEYWVPSRKGKKQAK